VAISRQYDANVYYARAKCLGASVLAGAHQKPFQGNLPYDYIVWIDSDMVWSPQQIEKLISNGVDICSGLYLMENGQQMPVVKEWDIEYFKEHGTFKFLTPSDLTNDDLIKVVYTGMGCMVVRQGVYESVSYPWFEPQTTTFGNVVDFASEDVSFCLKAQQQGFTIYVDPTVRCGHLKERILSI
jgi:cellulose synthase/poly-beta-1,6-N-acetylglucosamine synthase-like glycosyltransferase